MKISELETNYEKNFDQKPFEVYTPRITELAEKYNVSLAEVMKQVSAGVKIESEHSSEFSVALEITLDHLGETLDYYEKLASVEKGVNEVEKDTSYGKDWVSRYDFDEYIGFAEPTRGRIKGYQIWRVKDDDRPSYLAETLLIKDPTSEGFLGRLLLHNNTSKNFVHSEVAFDEELQGKGIAVPLYAYAIKNLKYNIVSDQTQTTGSQRLWEKLAKVPGIFVYAWSIDTGEFFQWDPEVDPEEDVYTDQDKVSELQVELRKALVQIHNDIDDGKISKDAGEQLIAKKKKEINNTISSMEKVRRNNVRLVATTTAGLKKKNK